MYTCLPCYRRWFLIWVELEKMFANVGFNFFQPVWTCQPPLISHGPPIFRFFWCRSARIYELSTSAAAATVWPADQSKPHKTEIVARIVSCWSWLIWWFSYLLLWLPLLKIITVEVQGAFSLPPARSEDINVLPSFWRTAKLDTGSKL